MGYTFEALQEKINGIVEQLPLTVESMNKMKQIQLSEEQSIDLATKALSTRFTESDLQYITVDIMELLKPTRIEDNGTDLWSVFNVIQEKIIDGDFNYNMGNKSRKARQIKNFQQDIKVNKELFALALEFAN